MESKATPEITTMDEGYIDARSPAAPASCPNMEVTDPDLDDAAMPDAGLASQEPLQDMDTCSGIDAPLAPGTSSGFQHVRTDSGNTAKHLGVAKDAVTIGDKGVSVGFGIAKATAKAGFGIASFFIRKPAELLEQATGPNPISTGLKGVDGVVGIAGKVTTGCQEIAESLTHATLNATKSGLSAAGAEENALMRMTVGDEMTEAVTLVEKTLSRYTSEMSHVPPTDLLTAAQAWGALQHASVAVHGHHGEEATLPENSERWMRFSAATLGAAWFAGLLEGFSGSASAMGRARAMQEKGGSPGDCAVACAGLEGHIDVIQFEERTNELYAPGYLVAADHAMGCVVVALRGTSSVTDALTDLVCEAAPIQLGAVDGLAHGGMLKAARKLDPELAKLAETALSRLGSQTRRRIVICGHSLGAGTASLLAALWRDRGFLPGVDIQCVAFATPQVLDPLLAAAQSNYTTTLMIEDDMVPRFSLATAQDLQAAMLCLNDPQSKGLSSSMHSSAILEAQSEGDTDRLAATYDVVRPLVCTSSERLYPAGRLIQLLPGRPLAVDSKAVDELFITRSMGSSHMPRVYLLAIQDALSSP